MRTLLTACLLLLTGCEAPRDAAGTLERLRQGGTARVGVAHNPPWTVVDGGRVSGIEPALVQGWARSLGASVRFTPGPESELVHQLHGGELDVLIARLEKKTPHKAKLAATQAYLKSNSGADQPGRVEQRVMAVSQGESATLLSLDRFLLEQDRGALERAAGQ